MYNWRTYFYVDVVTLLYKLDLKIWIGIFIGLYTISTIEEKGWEMLLKYNWHINTLASIELQLQEKLSLWDEDVWSVIPMFVSCLTPVSVNWYLHWLWSSQTVGETTECCSGNKDLLMTSQKSELILFCQKCHSDQYHNNWNTSNQYKDCQLFSKGRYNLQVIPDKNSDTTWLEYLLNFLDLIRWRKY